MTNTTTARNVPSATRANFVENIGFPLDPFQLEAMDALDRGSSVLVAAPTSSGKTIVAEYAIARALAVGERTFYTAPIKALSNQKYNDLCRQYGPSSVGLLTGDNNINGDAPIVVMTTEVLRNMIYANSIGLNNLGYVVLDEVHYLQNRERGPVWEEVIIHLSQSVDLVCLSATISNAKQFGDWITAVRGRTEVVVETKRPIPLRFFFAAQSGFGSDHGFKMVPLLHNDSQISNQADELDRKVARDSSGRVVNMGRGTRNRVATPRLSNLISHLADRDLLPAIHFIMSRKRCDEAVDIGLREGLQLTTADERERILSIVEHRVEGLSDKDLRTLGYERWTAGLLAGLASHHAGLIPPFKEAVEACFEQGLIKVVFATETLAYGINMPARTVIIDDVTKRSSATTFDLLDAAQFTQLIGRAGRRGFDPIGNVVTLFSPFSSARQIAALALDRNFNLSSAFEPTYNIATNLIRKTSAQNARHLLNLSFAQFERDSSVVGLEKRIDDHRRKSANHRSNIAPDVPDPDGYLALLDQMADLSASTAAPSIFREVTDVLATCVIGDVISVDVGNGPVAMAIMGIRGHGKSVNAVSVVGPKGRPKTLEVRIQQFVSVPQKLGALPPTNRGKNPKPHSLGDAQAALRELGLDSAPSTKRDVDKPVEIADNDAAIAVVEVALRAHPLHRRDDKDSVIRELRAASQQEGIAKRLVRELQNQSNVLARRFDRVLELLESHNYLDAQAWILSDSGSRLASLYHECDLRVSLALENGVFDGLDAAQLSAVVSSLIFEDRGRRNPPIPSLPLTDREVAKRLQAIELEHIATTREEQRLSITPQRGPDPGFVDLAFRWASRKEFADVLRGADMSGGDFVRNIKQLLDLMRQIADLSPVASTKAAATEACARLNRDVIVISTAVVPQLTQAELEQIEAPLASKSNVSFPPPGEALTAMERALHDAGLPIERDDLVEE